MTARGRRRIPTPRKKDDGKVKRRLAALVVVCLLDTGGTVVLYLAQHDWCHPPGNATHSKYVVLCCDMPCCTVLCYGCIVVHCFILGRVHRILAVACVALIGRGCGLWLGCGGCGCGCGRGRGG